MDDDNKYVVAIGAGLVGFILGCIWVKVSSKCQTHPQSGKLITTSYDDLGRLVSYLEQPVGENTTINQNYTGGASYGLGDLVQAESGRFESPEVGA